MREIHFVEVKYCKDTRPGHQLEASRKQHEVLCKRLKAKKVILHTILLGMGGSIHTSHTFNHLPCFQFTTSGGYCSGVKPIKTNRNRQFPTANCYCTYPITTTASLCAPDLAAVSSRSLLKQYTSLSAQLWHSRLQALLWKKEVGAPWAAVPAHHLAGHPVAQSVPKLVLFVMKSRYQGGGQLEPQGPFSSEYCSFAQL